MLFAEEISAMVRSFHEAVMDIAQSAVYLATPDVAFND